MQLRSWPHGLQRYVLCALVLALLACCNSAQQQQRAVTSAPSTAGRVQCSIRLTGNAASGNASGSIQEAALQCTGGSIVAAAAAAGGPSLWQRSTGVTWQAAPCGVDWCLLTICQARSADGRPATAQIKLHVVNVTNMPEAVWGAVCIAGSTSAELQGANITGNSIKSLVVSGAADVSLVNSTVAHNKDDGAVRVTGNATLTVTSSTFEGNQPWDTKGGAMFVDEQAQVTVTNSSFYDSIASWGGAVCALGNARVTLLGCFFANNWASWGGALYAGDNSTVRVADSRLLHNYVKDYNNIAHGGACYVYDTATLTLTNTTVHNNTAQNFGGGVAVDSDRATLLLGPGTTITANTAREGGGLYITRPLHNMTHAAHITVRNKAVISDDIGVNLTRLQLLSPARVPAFVPRLGDNKGLLPVRLRLSGPNNVSGATAVQAVLDGRPLARGSSDPVTGEAALNINLQRPPGTYTLRLEVLGMIDKLNTNMSVTVARCGPGEINVPEEHACLQCARGTYNFDQGAKECSPCPPNAICEEGTVIPEPGFWVSSLRSNQTHRCLHPAACAQRHTAAQLQQYQSLDRAAAAAAQATFMAAQCASGHEGNLCGRCSQGYGQRLSSFTGRCRHCSSSTRIICTFLAAALASLAFIKLLCTLQSIQSAAALRRAAAAAQQQPAAAGSTATAAAAGGAADHSASKAASMQALEQETAAAVKLPGIPGKPSGDAAAATTAATAAAAAAAAPPSGPLATAAGKRPHVPPGDLLKPFVVYLQWMLVVVTVNVEWPETLLSPFSALSFMFSASNTSSGLDCLLAASSTSGLPRPIQKVLFGLLMPVALLAVLLLWDVAAAACRQRMMMRRRRGRRGGRHLPVLRTQAAAAPPPSAGARLPAGAMAQTAIVLTFFFLPSLLRMAYGLFACVQLDKPPAAAAATTEGSFLKFNAVGSFWLLDTDQRCFAGYHRAWAAALGVPLLLVLCCAVPCGVTAKLWRNRSRLAEPYFVQHYGFLFESYTPRLCFWEGVVAMQTCVVVAISVFGATLGAAFQCIILSLAFAASLLLLAVYAPFTHAEANLVGMHSCGCLMLSANAALVFDLLSAFGSPADNSSSSSSSLHAAGPKAAANGVAAAVFVVNVAFVLSVAWRVLRAVDWPRLLGIAQRMCKVAGGARCWAGCCRSGGGSGGGGGGGCCVKAAAAAPAQLS